MTKAHPRPCGEHNNFAGAALVYTGSSPPVRGAPECSSVLVEIAGLIPARAGSTDKPPSFLNSCRAHPRPCGEHVTDSSGASSQPGSSPPVRGAPKRVTFFRQVSGLIPARAGSTTWKAPLGHFYGAHPRPCGEHLWVYRLVFGAAGSSPPVRGAHLQGPLQRGRVGLIPARAGSTLQAGLYLPRSWAHPRPCGEHNLRSTNQHSDMGSSPPVRGAPVGGFQVHSISGLIPARAGSTFYLPWW